MQQQIAPSSTNASRVEPNPPNPVSLTFRADRTSRANPVSLTLRTPGPKRTRRTRRTRRTARGAVLVALAVVLLAGACAKSDTATTPGSTSGSTAGTLAAAPVDYSKPGPYKVGLMRIIMGDRLVAVFYPADPAGIDKVQHVTSYNTGEIFSPELKATIATLIPEFVRDIPLDVYQDAKINPESAFPVILHSHGAGGYPMLESGQLSNLASWGFVAAAPDHKSRNLSSAAGAPIPVPDDVTDLRNTMDLLKKENARADGPLKGGLDFAKLGAEGHSAGGRAVVVFSSDAANGVKSVIGIEPAPPISFTRPPPADPTAPSTTSTTISPEERLATTKAGLADKSPPAVPSMIIQGDSDGIIPLAVVQLEYDWLKPPKRMVVIAKGGHNITLDICRVIREQGGLSKYNDKLPAFAGLFRLGEDGCTEGSLDPAKGYAVSRHLTVAQFRWSLGLDPSQASLDPAYLRRTFPETIADVQSQN